MSSMASRVMFVSSDVSATCCVTRKPKLKMLFKRYSIVNCFNCVAGKEGDARIHSHFVVSGTNELSRRFKFPTTSWGLLCSYSSERHRKKALSSRSCLRGLGAEFTQGAQSYAISASRSARGLPQLRLIINAHAPMCSAYSSVATMLMT